MLLCYDASAPAQLDALLKRFGQIKDLTSNDVPIYVCACRCDLKQQVSEEDSKVRLVQTVIDGAFFVIRGFWMRLGGLAAWLRSSKPALALAKGSV